MQRKSLFKPFETSSLSKFLTVLMPILSLIAVVVLNGCSKEKKATLPSDSGYDYPTKSQAKDAVNNWKVVCENSQDCPNNVAQLLVLDDTHVTNCTATLIDKDLVLTNSHCLDSSLNAQQLCETGISVRFADNSAGGGETAKCVSVLKRSTVESGRANAPDYAVLKLDHELTRTPVKVLRTGIVNQEALKIAKVDPAKAGRGVLRVATCQAVLGSYVLPGAISSEFPVEVIKDCAVSHGDSGAPLLDEDGNLRAILHAGYLGRKGHESEYKQLSEMHVSYITNAACMDYTFKDAGAAPASCTSSATSSALDQTYDAIAEQQKILDDVNAQLQTSAQTDTGPLGFRILVLNNFQTIQYRPYCFANVSQVLRAQNTSGLVTLQSYEIVWKVLPKISDDLQIHYSVSAKRKIPITLQVSAENLTRSHNADVTLAPAKMTDQNQARSQRWGVCASSLPSGDAIVDAPAAPAPATSPAN